MLFFLNTTIGDGAMDIKKGIISRDNLSNTMFNNEHHLFADSFKIDLKGCRNEFKDVPFELVVDCYGQFTFEITKDYNVGERAEMYHIGSFEFNCRGEKTKSNLICKEATICFKFYEKANERLPKMIIKPIIPAILKMPTKDNNNGIRLYMIKVDRFSVPDLNPDKRDGGINLGSAGFLFCREHYMKSMNTHVVTITKGNDQLPDDCWFEKANNLLDRLVCVMSFAQGGKIPIPIVETIRGGEVETKLIYSDIGSATKFMPVIKNQNHARNLIRSSLSKDIPQEQWVRIKKAIDFSVSVQRFGEIELLTKIVAIESVIKSYSDVTKRGIREAIKQFMAMEVDRDKRERLFKDDLAMLPKKKRGRSF